MLVSNAPLEKQKTQKNVLLYWLTWCSMIFFDVSLSYSMSVRHIFMFSAHLLSSWSTTAWNINQGEDIKNHNACDTYQFYCSKHLLAWDLWCICVNYNTVINTYRVYEISNSWLCSWVIRHFGFSVQKKVLAQAPCIKPRSHNSKNQGVSEK